MSEKKFQILERETLFQGYFRVDRFHVRHERFAGDWSRPFTREVFDRNGNVAGILPFDPVRDKVVLVEQFRTGPLAAGEEPWITEAVAGIIDGGETPEQAARRETLEETGCEVQELHAIANYYSSPGGTSEHIALFAARVAAPAEGSVRGLAHEDEDIRVHVLDAAKAISLLYGNQIRDALTLIALQWFAMHHTELRSRWLVSDVGTPII
ncbi:MAG TPA: NUDIX domain-containing protein [Alphaproteobacteria bacterium]|nr:NUDIX domain-containing protein [Alphaproteobacteria bacterium]